MNFAKTKTFLAVGEPDFPLSEHHSLISNEQCLKGCFGRDLLQAGIENDLICRMELLGVADYPPDLSADGQRILDHTGD